MKLVFSKNIFFARVIERNTCLIFTEGFTRLVHIPDLTWIYTCMDATLRWLKWTPFFTKFVDIFCPWNFYYGRFTYTANPVELYSLQSHLLKSSGHHSPLVPFSPLVLVFFYLGLLVVAATVLWRAQSWSAYHTTRLGRILLRESFLWKIGKIVKTFFPFCMCEKVVCVQVLFAWKQKWGMYFDWLFYYKENWRHWFPVSSRFPSVFHNHEPQTASQTPGLR